MHYHAEIWLPDLPGDAQAAVDAAMDPHKENDDCTAGFWDWYQIGGRWKGVHLGDDYDPEQDAANIGCDGRLAWPTEWKPHNADVMALESVPDTLTCATVIVGENAYRASKWDGEDWVAGEMPEGQPVRAFLESLGFTTGYLVTVDYHD